MSNKSKHFIMRLKALLPNLEYSRETHVEWRDCHQKYRDENPRIGDAKFHQTCVDDYDERITAINDTIEFFYKLEEFEKIANLSFDELLKVCKPFTQEEVDDIKKLIDGVEVNLEEPL